MKTDRQLAKEVGLSEEEYVQVRDRLAAAGVMPFRVKHLCIACATEEQEHESKRCGGCIKRRKKALTMPIPADRV